MANDAAPKAPLPDLKGAEQSTFQMLKRLIVNYGLDHKGRFAFAVVCMLLVAASTAGIAWLTRSMVNSIFVTGTASAITTVGLAVMGTFVIRGVASYFQMVSMGEIGASITSKLQREQFAKLMKMQMSYFTIEHANAMTTRVLFGARAARAAIELAATNLIRDVATVLALVVVMFVQDPFMSVFALVIAPPLVYGIYRISRAIKDAGKDEADIAAGVHVVGFEALQGLEVVKSFGLEPIMQERIGAATAKMERRQNALNRLQAIPSPLFDVIGGVILGAFVFYMGWQTTANGKSPGEFVAFLAAFLLAYEPARRLGNLNVKLQRQMIAVRRFFEIMDEEARVEPQRGAPDETPFSRGDLAFRDVTFRYRAKGPAVLDALSFDARPGERVAIVGRSGAGKSTVVNLLLGAYGPDDGDIVIDGRPVSEVSLGTLRRAVSYVGQHTFLFSGTLADNVRYGAPGASDDAVREALRQASALEFVEALPNGIDTEIGDNAKTLSGGQRQRIAIARAFIKRAPILVLDEATSALDGESERVVRDAVDRVAEGRTTIVIAHRLSTIESVDRVLVMDRGQIVAEGTHEALTQGSPLYRTLFKGGENAEIQDDLGEGLMDREPGAPTMPEETDRAA